MLRHIVIYTLKDNSQQSKDMLKEKFLSMKGKVKQLINIDAGSNIVQSDRAFDFALVCDFASIEQLNEYLVDPYHQEVRQYVKSVTVLSHSVDFLI